MIRGAGNARAAPMVMGGALLIAGAGLWFSRQWARWAATLLFVVLAGVEVWLVLAKGFSWMKLIWLACATLAAWSIWRDFDPRRIGVEDEAGEEKPMISLVLLLRQHRYLEGPILAQIVSSAWGGDYVVLDPDETDCEHPDRKSDTEELIRWVGGRSPFFMVNVPEGLFVVHNHDRPYFDEPEKVVEETNELRLRQAIEQNQAWLAVDLMHAFDATRPIASFYPQVARLVAELAGPDCLAVFQPEPGRINLWDASLEEKLRGSDPLSVFGEPTHVPVIQVDDDDPRMVAAVAEARRRWPEFVEAFNRNEGEHFSVKAPITADGNTEFIWIEVAGLEPEYIHGRLGNDPVDLGSLKLGDPVEILLKDLNDWAFIRDDKPVGMFTVKVLSELQKERERDRA